MKLRWTGSLNDTVRDLDPALARKYPPIAKKTVRQLLGMTSRIPDYAEAAVQIMVGDHQHSFTRDDLIALGRATAQVEHSDDLSAEVILAQVRSIVADMLALCGMDPLEATDVIPLR